MLKLARLGDMPVRLNARIKKDKVAPVTGYYTCVKYYELLREMLFIAEDNEHKGTKYIDACQDIYEIIEEYDNQPEAVKRGKDGWKYLADYCKDYERLIK